MEVLHDEKWGTVCEKGFSDGSAEMVCKALGQKKQADGDIKKLKIYNPTRTEMGRSRPFAASRAQVQVSKDGMAWEDAFCGRYFTGNKNRNGKVKTIFPYPLYARHVRGPGDEVLLFNSCSSVLMQIINVWPYNGEV